ncbi:MAG: ATP-dependent sacrificial sulfur transferase LarE [Nitrospirae bacterium]|nr:ATP-dependent sacrificial sulfur transferase LarE [Nitrospirota bacterium]
MPLNGKFSKLKETLRQMESVIIAYSGGVDSTFLLKAASMSNLKQILAVTADSESLPKNDLLIAKQMVSSLNVSHRTIKTEELGNENFSNNSPQRCYYCKKELFCKLKALALKEGFSYVLDGTNADDANDYRPGRNAALETGIRSPLFEVGLSKNEIRELSREIGLPTWDKPASPCLASRFPYGQRITAEDLKKIEESERFLKRFGLKELRVRHHGDIARIEVMPEEISIFANKERRAETVSFLKSMGFKYVTIDLQGFRSGNLNEK